MDLRLKIAAFAAWTIAVALTFFTDFDTARWILPLAVGCYAAGACVTACVVLRSCARATRRAVYHQRRWDDTPDAAVLQLMRQPDAVDRTTQRTVARRGSQTATPMVPHI